MALGEHQCVLHQQSARLVQNLREVMVDAGKESHRKHAAAVISLLQAPQRALQLSVASLPEVPLGTLRTATMMRR